MRPNMGYDKNKKIQKIILVCLIVESKTLPGRTECPEGNNNIYYSILSPALLINTNTLKI